MNLIIDTEEQRKEVNRKHSTETQIKEWEENRREDKRYMIHSEKIYHIGNQRLGEERENRTELYWKRTGWAFSKTDEKHQSIDLRSLMNPK